MDVNRHMLSKNVAAAAHIGAETDLFRHLSAENGVGQFLLLE